MRGEAEAVVHHEHDALTIAEMARRYNVTFRALRFYEQIGLLNPTRVNKDRIYSPKDEIRLQIVQCGKKLGFSLREIDKMIKSHLLQSSNDPQAMHEMLDVKTVEKQLVILEQQRADVDDVIGELKAALV